MKMLFSSREKSPPIEKEEDFNVKRKYILLSEAKADEIEKCINDHFQHGYNIESKTVDSYIKRIKVDTIGSREDHLLYTAEMVFVKKE